MQPEDGKSVLVVGCGPIGGLAALVLARQPGRGPVLVADRNAARLAKVAAVTGAIPIALDKASVLAAVSEPLRFAIDASGSTVALQALLDIVANGATIAAGGIFHAKLDFDPNIVVERELTLKGCSAFADELPQAIELLPKLADDLRQFVGEEINLDAIPDAYQRLLGGKAAGLKTIVRPTPFPLE